MKVVFVSFLSTSNIFRVHFLDVSLFVLCVFNANSAEVAGLQRVTRSKTLVDHWACLPFQDAIVAVMMVKR